MNKKRVLPALFTTTLLSLGLVVVSTPAKTEVVKAASEYVKANSIAVGDEVLLVYEGKNMELSGISTTSTKYGVGKAYTDLPVGAFPLEVVEGASAGTYALKNGSNYLYWSSGNSLATNTTLSANTSWKISFDNGNAVILNGKDNARKLQWNASSPRFACYTSAQTAIQLYKKVTIDSDATVTLDAPTVSFAYDGTASWSAVAHAVEYKYSINGGEVQTTTNRQVKLNDGETIKVQAVGNGDKILDSEWSEVSTYTRSDYYLTIGQALEMAKTAGANYTTINYVVEGKVKSIANTTFGNLTIEDETGSLYIYGVYSADGSVRYDKMVKGQKPTVGDTITLLGVLGTYNSSPQMKNGWMIDIKLTHEHTGSFKHDEEGHWKECTHCGTTFAEASHVMTDTVTAPTCADKGYTTHACECGYSYQDTEVAELGHTYGEATYAWNEDYTECTATRTCTTDETHVETETVEATVETVESTCSAAGSKTYVATFENSAFAVQTYKEDLEIAAHTWGEATYSWNEDHTECTATRTCTADETHVETETVEATVETVESTCKVAGSKTYTVAFTNEAFAAQTHTEELALKEHVYDEGVVTTEPTQEQEGVKTFTCGGCGHTYTEAIAKLPATSEDPSEEPSEEPTEPTKKGCKGSTAGLIGLVTLAGALLLSKKRK